MVWYEAILVRRRKSATLLMESAMMKAVIQHSINGKGPLNDLMKALSKDANGG